MRVGITGGGGFIGTTVCDLLLKYGHNVVVVDNLYRQTDYLISLCNNNGFRFVNCDILDNKKLGRTFENVDCVVHLAGIVGAPLCAANPTLATAVNVEGTQNVADLCKNRGIPVLFASTGSVYGKVEGVCTEDSPLNALSLYGLNKIEGEKIIREVPAHIIYRFSTAFGTSGNIRVSLLANDLVYRAVKEKAIVIFQADFRRSFVHVRDIASAIFTGITNFDLIGGQTYNVGHPLCNWSKRKLAEYIKLKTGCFVAYADEGYVDPDGRDYEIDFSRMDKFWKAKITMEQGIDELIRACEIINISHGYK